MNSYTIRLWGLVLFCMLLGSACKQATQAVQASADKTYAQAKTFQLAQPGIENGESLFEGQTTVILSHGYDNVALRYTLDGSPPDQNSPVYSDSISISQTASLYVRAYHPDFLPSAVVRRQFIKLPPSVAIQRITLNREPHPNYPGTSAEGLVDRKKGSTNFRTKHWMGFDGGEVIATIQFVEAQSINGLMVSLLSDQGSWIFLPARITIEVSEDGANYQKIHEQEVAPTEEGAAPELVFTKIDLSRTITPYLRVRIQPMENIPDWHPGKGTPPWLFMDEILIETI